MMSGVETTFFLLLTIMVFFVSGSVELDTSLAREKRAFLGKCIQDKECKTNQFCDHTWPNPIGECKTGYKNGDKCTFDRHCSSKACHTFKCVARKPVKDGLCQKNKHDECIPEQYCYKDKCKNRKCSGWCKNNAECLSNSCELLRCKKTANCK